MEAPSYEMDARRAWDAIAGSYYDEHAHPRTAALRAASNELISQWATRLASTARVLEVGAGAGFRWTGRGDVVAVDISVPMLLCRATHTWTFAVQADAVALPFRARSFDAIVAALGAPFNSAEFWEETHRLLKPGGTAALTAPERSWAMTDRGDKSQYIDFGVAASPVRVASIVRSEQDQRAVTSSAGLRLTQRATAEASVMGTSATVDIWVVEKEPPT